MRQVWSNRWFEAADALGRDLRHALRSLGRAKGLAATVVVTLALGIGANAAIFSVVRQVLLRPLVNRDEDRLIYIRQSALGLGGANTTFSVPEIGDLRSRVTAIGAFGEFSTINFSMAGFGEPRVIKAGVVDGSYFDVMGLRPVLGRLLCATDDGPDAAGAVVLTHRFWSTALNSDPSVIGRTIRLGSRSATVVGVLEPSVPYPADTEIIANIVTSPHHLGATMVTRRTHRMTELFGRLAPGATIDRARDELVAAHDAMVLEHPDAYTSSANLQLSVTRLRDQITAPARTILLALLAAAGLVFAIACSNVANLILARAVRRERELSIRAALGAGTGALRRTLMAESLVLCGAGAVLGVVLARPLVNVVAGYAARFSVRAHDVTVDASLLWVGSLLALHCRRSARVRSAAAVAVRAGDAPFVTEPDRTDQRTHSDHPWHEPPPARIRHHADRALVRAARRRRDDPRHARLAAARAHRVRDAAGARGRRAAADRSRGADSWSSSSRKRPGASSGCRASSAWRSATSFRGAMPAPSGPASSSRSRDTRRRTARRIPMRACGTCRPDSSPRSASR